MPLGRARPSAPSLEKVIGKEFDRRRPITSPTFFASEAARPDARKNKRRVIFVRNADGTFTGQYSDGANWQSFLATSISFAVPTITYATTAADGALSKTIRSDARLKFPTAIMSSANSSTLTLTDDATDMTLTGSLGGIIIVPNNNMLELAYWNGAGGTNATSGVILGFIGLASILGSTLITGIEGAIQFNLGTTWSVGNNNQTHRAGKFTITNSSTASQVFTSVVERGLDVTLSGATISTGGANTWAERTGAFITMGGIVGSQAGTHTDTQGLRITGWPQIGTAGTYTNAYVANCQLPTIGGTIRRGYNLSTITGNIGTEAANVEGYYCEDITRGTGQRVSFYAEGATNSTPTDVYGFYQGTAHVVGTNRYGFRATGATTGTPTLCVAFYADAHSVGTTQWAFFSAGDESHFVGVQQDDNSKDVYGTGRDAELYYDGTDFVCDPDVVGTGSFDIRGPLKCDSITNDTGLAAGVFTPTRSAEANLDANVTMSEGQYMRVGNTVTMSGRFTANPTAAGATSFEFSLPVASNIGAAEDLAGVAFSGAIAGQGAEITGSVANNTAVVSWIAVDVTNQSWAYTLTYQVI